MNTDNKTLAVDVLAVIMESADFMREDGYTHRAIPLEEAHAALAEMIVVYEELLNELREISDDAGQEPYNNPRANAAIARVKGESA